MKSIKSSLILISFILFFNQFGCNSESENNDTKSLGLGLQFDKDQVDKRSITLNNKALKYYDPLNIDTNNLKLAITLLDSAILIDSNYRLAYFNKAQILSELDQNLDALNTIKIIEHREPDLAEAKTMLGEYYYKSGMKDSTYIKYKQAMHLYENRLESIDSNYLSNKLNLIFLKTLINFNFNGFAALDSLLEESPEDSLNINMIKQAMEGNDFQSRKMELQTKE